jgi:hypothetical protein
MFSHHILKPERTPLEANLWGTPRSSGAFSTLFESRILRALDYCENPFEISSLYNNGKITGEKIFRVISHTIVNETGIRVEEHEVLFELFLERAMYTRLENWGTIDEQPWHQSWRTSA